MFIKLPRWVATVIEKINVAWKIEYVEYSYQKACETCATKGLCNHCDCDKCALKVARDRAIKEINEGLRKPLEKVKRGCYMEKVKRGCYTANNIHGTQVMNCYDAPPKERVINSMNNAPTFEELKATRLKYCSKCSRYPTCANCTVKHTFESNIRRFI